MKNIVVEFDEKMVFEKANEYFVKICGFEKGNYKHEKMYSSAMESRCLGMSGIRIRAVISSFGPEVFHNHRVSFQESVLYCPAFEEIESNCVKKVYLYALTVGECLCRDEDDIICQVYSDIWGTAYTDSARDLLEEYIRQDMMQEFVGQLGNEIFLSDAFGPGFYGMDVSQTKDLFGILDTKSIGLQVRDSGIMLPLKSCSGLYFAVTDTSPPPHPTCRECLGSHMGCSFCKFRPVRRKQLEEN